MNDIDIFEQMCGQYENNGLMRKLIANEVDAVAFLDAEFNDGEVCSIGISAMSSDNKELETLYFVIKPITKTFMQNRLEELTGLKYETLVDQGVDFYYACEQINSFLHAYGITDIYVWGSDDQRVFRMTAKAYRENSEKTVGKEVFKFISYIKNIDQTVSEYLVDTGEPISLNSLACICDVTNDAEHNALGDARCLMKCVSVIRKGEIDVVKINKYKKYDKLKSRYIKSRRASSMLVQSTKSQEFVKIEISQDIKDLYNTDPSVKAYIDDGVEIGLVDCDFDNYHKGFFKFEDYLKGGEKL